MHTRHLTIALLASVVVACGTAPPKTEIIAPLQTAPPAEPSPGFRLPADTRPLDYALWFDLDPTKESFAGTAKIKLRLDTARRTIWLHGRGLEVTRATVAGKPARWAQVDDDGQARLSLDAAVGPGEVEVELAWTAKLNAALESVYRVQSEGRWYVFTQFEAISAREAFPCFDEPGFKAPFSLSFTTRKDDVVVANTLAAERAVEADGRVRTAFHKTQPLPTYLVAFAVGPLEIVEGAPLPATAIRKEPVPIRGVATKGKGKLLARSLDVHLRSLAALERYFGIPYPYGKLDFVAVPDFSGGAMENAGLVTYRDSLLFVDDTSPIGLQKSNAHVIAHELAHQWFGNFVTLAWWDDLWLNEAFASWMQPLVVNEIRPDLNATVDARAALDWVHNKDSLVSARQIRQPVLSKGDIVNAFDGITYTKGASVIAMFESWVGAAALQTGVREYLKAHAHGTATATDLLSAVSAAAGKDVTTPFSTFLDQPGVPFVEAKIVCDAKAKTAALELAQSRYLPVGSTGDRHKTWQLPVCARYAVGGALKTSCTLLTEVKGTLPLETRACPALVHPNADFVGYYRWSVPGEQLRTISASLKKLTPGERMSFGNAIRAGAYAGTVTYKDALDASLPLAKDAEPKVAATPFGLLAFAWSDLVEPAARPRVMKKLADTYRPVIDQVKLLPKSKEDPRVRERRTLALSALTVAEDPKVQGELAKLGRAMLGEGSVDLSKAPADLHALAIAAAVKRGGPSAWENAAARLSVETDSLVRNYLIGALASVTDPALTSRALDLALDPRLKVNEVAVPLQLQAGDARTRDAAWAWLPAHYDAVVARLPESHAGARIVSALGGFCSEDKAKEIEAFFGPKKEKAPGMERALAQSLEDIRLCAAKKAALQESARRVFPR